MARPKDKNSRHNGNNRVANRESGRKTGAGGQYPSIFQPSPFTEESRRKRARDKRRRKFAGWPSRLMVVLAFLVSAAGLLAYLPQFIIESVNIDGARYSDQAVIMSLAKEKEGSHFLQGMGGSAGKWLSLRYGLLEDQILQTSPMIRSARVRFRFPSTLVIRLEEKVEILAVRVSGGYALVDRDHEVLRIAETRDFALPVLEDLPTTGGIVQGQTLPVEDTDQLIAASHLIAGLIFHDQSDQKTRILMEEIQQIRQVAGSQFMLFIPLSQGGEIRVRLEDNRLLQEKLSLLSYLLDREDIIPPVAGELDLTGETTYFRPDEGGGDEIGLPGT